MKAKLFLFALFKVNKRFELFRTVRKQGAKFQADLCKNVMITHNIRTIDSFINTKNWFIYIQNYIRFMT